MIQTKTKTQTVTNTQLVIAVAAAFLAGGLAFAAAPAANQGTPVAGACSVVEANTVYTHAINGTRQLCPNNGYWGARFTCTDRKNDTVNVGVGNPCVTEAQILDMIRTKCKDQTHLCVPRNTTPVGGVVTGSLTMSIDTDYNNLRFDQYALSGSDRFMAGRIKLQANGENVNLRNIALLFSANNPHTTIDDLRGSIDSVSLYSDPTLAEAKLIGTADFSSSTIIIQDVNYTVTKGVPAYIYIGLKINSFGTAMDGTSVPGTSFVVKVSPVGNRIVGTSSNNPINPVVVVGHTNDVTITPIKITNVTSDFVGGSLIGGNQTIGSFKITADGGHNTNSSGDPMQIHLLQLGLQLTTDVATANAQNVSNLQLCRVDSGNCMDIMPVTPFTTHTNTSVLTASERPTTTIYVENFIVHDDEYIDSGETVEFLVRGTFENTVDHFAQLRLINLHNKGVYYGMDGDGDGLDDYSFTDMRKEAPRGNDYPSLIMPALE